jgi:hypothetical protein
MSHHIALPGAAVWERIAGRVEPVALHWHHRFDASLGAPIFASDCIALHMTRSRAWSLLCEVHYWSISAIWLLHDAGMDVLSPDP